MKPTPLARIEIKGKTKTLAQGQRLKLGRAPDNDLVLRGRSVSRYHALLDWPQDADLPLVRDLGSQNGTLLNGELISSARALADGARVYVDPFELVVRLEGVTKTPALLKESSPLSNPMDGGTNMTGLLRGPGSGHELVLHLESDRRTGQLKIGKDSVLFCVGRVMIRGPEDRRALDRMACAKAGTYYRFNTQFEPQSSSSRQLLWPSKILGPRVA